MSTHGNSITLSQALAYGIETARQCTAHQKNQLKAVRQLQDWFESAGVVYWDDLTIDHIRKYVASLESRGLSPCTIRAYTNPLRLAHRATRTEIGADYLKLRDLIPPRQTPEKRFLSVAQVKTALKWADTKADHAGYFCLAMGAMAGLRITEAMRIIPSDYDAAEQTLIVGRDERKNEHSARVIPLTDAAASVLEWHFEQPGTRRRKQGDPYKATTSLSHSVRRILNEAHRLSGDSSFLMVKPAEAGRKTFMNALEEAGANYNYIRAYCGQAPERWDILTRHYLALVPRVNSLPHVRDKAMAGLHLHIVQPASKLF